MADALSSVLDILDVRVAASARLEAAGSWGLSFPEPGQLKVIAVLAGQCWLTAGAAGPVPGPLVLMPGPSWSVAG